MRSSRNFAAASLSQAVEVFRTVDTDGIAWDGTGSAEAARADDVQAARNGRANTDPKDFMVYPVAPASLPVKALLLID
jgi:ATP-dependent Clp protease adapter protein ClpS